MRNRAKCKLCNSIIESFHQYDFVQCTCGEIFVDSGEGMRCGAKNWENFLRVDDEDNIIIPKIEEKETIKSTPSSKDEYIKEFSNLVSIYNELPQEAINSYVTHYDLHTILILLNNILKKD